jgi:hypothetical protein
MVDFVPLKRLSLKKDFKNKIDIECGVSELIRHIDMESLEELGQKYNCHTIKQPEKYLEITHTVKTRNGHFENVCEINGIAIPINFELTRREGHCTVLEHLIKNSERFPSDHRDKILTIRRHLTSNRVLLASDILYLANLFASYVSGYNCKREQITNYNWISEELFTQTNYRLNNYINKNAQYEKEISASLIGRKITGHLDIVQDNIIWELKCVKALEPVHFIQILVYGWLYMVEFNKEMKLQVLNVLTDEIIEVVPNCELSEIVAFLIEKRWGKKDDKISDSEFLDMINTSVTNIGCSNSITKTNKKSKLLTKVVNSNCLIMSDSDSDSDLE